MWPSQKHTHKSPVRLLRRMQDMLQVMDTLSPMDGDMCDTTLSLMDGDMCDTMYIFMHE